MSSYFDEAKMSELIDNLKKQADSPEWLVAVLDELAKGSQLFPTVEDDSRYVEEHIYPH